MRGCQGRAPRVWRYAGGSPRKGVILRTRQPGRRYACEKSCTSKEGLKLPEMMSKSKTVRKRQRGLLKGVTIGSGKRL